MPDEETKDTDIPVNLRLLIILEEMAAAGVPVTPTEVNRVVGLPKPTIHRLFATLEDHGFIQREIDGRGYSPGQRLRKLSSEILSSLRIRMARTAVLRRLADEIGETCNIAMPEREDMVYVDRVETKWPLRIQLPIGSTVPFYCTASGKMYLSTLDDKHLKSYVKSANLKARTKRTVTSPEALADAIRDIRTIGYSTDNEEFMDGMIAVAVPINDQTGRLVSTLSFHAPVQRLRLSDAIKHVETLKIAASDLSALISGSG
ncbi:MAG: IclR family transcriptional regulator [Pseudomonadota bacterium]